MSSEHAIHSSSWWEIYGEPTTTARKVEVEQVAEWYQSGTMVPGKDFVVVDVRRSDCETILPGAINLPAQSLVQTMSSLLPMLSTFKHLVFHCNRSLGRGARAAGWTADALISFYQSFGSMSEQKAKAKVQDQVLVLKGGIVAWEEKYDSADIQDRGRKWDGKSLHTLQL